jgi:DNA repair ATPase RecN
MDGSTMGNGYDPAVLQNVVGRIEHELAELLSERGAYMQRCKVIRDRINEIYEEAKEANQLPKKVLRKLIQTREFERKIEANLAKLEEDDRQLYQALEDALGDFGDTPLGQAALDRARPREDDAGASAPLSQ